MSVPGAACGALLLGYYTEDGRLHYTGRAGTGITAKELQREDKPARQVVRAIPHPPSQDRS
jgi:ATP-dependent DNA ligase